MKELKHLMNLLRERWQIDQKIMAVKKAIHDFSVQHEILTSVWKVIIAFLAWLIPKPCVVFLIFLLILRVVWLLRLEILCLIIIWIYYKIATIVINEVAEIIANLFDL